MQWWRHLDYKLTITARINHFFNLIFIQENFCTKKNTSERLRSHFIRCQSRTMFNHLHKHHIKKSVPRNKSWREREWIEEKKLQEKLSVYLYPIPKIYWFQSIFYSLHFVTQLIYPFSVVYLTTTFNSTSHRTRSCRLAPINYGQCGKQHHKISVILSVLFFLSTLLFGCCESASGNKAKHVPLEEESIRGNWLGSSKI